jgi:hypothetical protein
MAGVTFLGKDRFDFFGKIDCGSGNGAGNDEGGGEGAFHRTVGFIKRQA